MKKSMEFYMNAAGWVIGLGGAGYAVGVHCKMNALAKKLDSKIDRLADDAAIQIPEYIIKDAVDKGTLAMVAAVDLSYLNVKMQKLIQQVAEAEGKKLKPKQAVELRKMGKDITKEAVESVLAGKEQKKPQSVSVKLPMELYEKYFAQMDAGAVQRTYRKQ